jgi:hypothetical protein
METNLSRGNELGLAMAARQQRLGPNVIAAIPIMNKVRFPRMNLIPFAKER